MRTRKLLGLSKAQDSEQEKCCEMKVESQTRQIVKDHEGQVSSVGTASCNHFGGTDSLSGRWTLCFLEINGA